jgi:Family of unknown function (DUF5681)
MSKQRNRAARSTQPLPRVAQTPGYGRPPLHSQFKKGKSGNPLGRPKGAKSLKTLIRRGLMRTLVDPETKRRITVAEALLEKQVKLGLKGSGTSTFTIFKLADQFGAFDEVDSATESDLTPSEQAVLDFILKNTNKSRDGDQG